MVEPRNLTKSIIKNSLYIYIGKVTATIFSSLIFIFIARKLSIADYGFFSLFSSSLILFAVVIPLGFPTAVLRFVPELVEKDLLNSAACLVKRCVALIWLWGFILLVMIFIFGDVIAAALKNPFLSLYFPLWVFIGIIGAQIALLETVSHAVFLQYYNALYDTLMNILQFILVIIFLKLNFGLYGIMLAMAIANVFLFILYYTKTNSVLSKVPSRLREEVDFKRFLRFSAKEFLMKATAFFWDAAVDVYLITYFLGAASAGLFGFAAFICFFLANWMPGMALQNLIRPLLVKVYTANKSNKQLNELIRLYYKIKAFFIFPVVIIMWLLIDKVILIIFQGKFLPAAGTFRVLLFFAMMQSFVRPLNNVFALLERNEVPLYANIVIFYKIPASIFLIKYFGIIGAAWAFGSSILIMFLIQYFWLRRIVDIKFPYLSWFKILGNSLITGLLVFLLSSMITDIFSLAAVSVAGLLSYAGISYLNKVFMDNERSLINRIAGMRVWHF